MRLLVGIQSLVHQFPRGLYTQPKKQYLVAVHSGSSLRIFRVIWHRLPGEFHSKRRGAFFGSLKSEWTPERGYRSYQEAQSDILTYLTHYYNRERPHSFNDYLPPVSVEARPA